MATLICEIDLDSAAMRDDRKGELRAIFHKMVTDIDHGRAMGDCRDGDANKIGTWRLADS